MLVLEATLAKKIEENLKKGVQNQSEILTLSSKGSDAALTFYNIMDDQYRSAIELQSPPIERVYSLLGSVSSQLPKPLALTFLASSTWEKISETIMTNLDLSQPIDPRFKAFMNSLRNNFDDSPEYIGLMQCVESMQVEDLATANDPLGNVRRMLENCDQLQNEISISSSEAKKREMERILEQFDRPENRARIDQAPDSSSIRQQIARFKNFLEEKNRVVENTSQTVVSHLSLDELLKASMSYRDTLKAEVSAILRSV